MRNGYRDLLCTTRDDVLVIELNRPEKRNAMRLELRQELIDCLLAVEGESSINAVVVTGAGDKAFSAGADLSELQTRTVDSELSRAAELRRRLPQVAETLNKPIIAAINGACIGAGLEFALACPVRIASEQATFSLPEVRIGVIPGSGGTQRLARVVGLGWAMYLTLLGETIDARKALDIGLVAEVLPPDQLLNRAVDLARMVGAQPRMAFLAARDAINRTFDVDLQSGLDLERKLFALCLTTGVPAERASRLLQARSSHGDVKGSSTERVTS